MFIWEKSPLGDLFLQPTFKEHYIAKCCLGVLEWIILVNYALLLLTFFNNQVNPMPARQFENNANK